LMTRYRPVTVDTPEGDTFEVHLGQPGKPKVYRRVGSSVRKVQDEPTLLRVAQAMREGVDRRRAFQERERKRKQTRTYRFFRWLGRLVGRVWNVLMRR
jgi:hypothetical protein